MGFLGSNPAERLERAGLLDRDPVAPAPGVNGEPPTPSFIATCQRARAGPRTMWLRHRDRCTGIVPWNLPGRGVKIPVLGAAIPLAAGLLPGGSTVLGLLGGTGMSNGGFQAPVGVGVGGGVGVGICPPGTRCIGAEAFGACLGTCVPTTAGGPVPILPPGGGTAIGPVYTDPTTGQTVAVGPKKRRRMNYSNQKALRRALRRATGYARQQKAVRKAASEFAREFGPKRRAPRRDLGPGHRHVR